MRTLQKKDRGREVLDVQTRLSQLGYNLGSDGVDGFFGEGTFEAVRCFQQRSGLVADGVIAENTWCELVEARYETGERLLYLRIPPFRGNDVLLLQRSLNKLGFNSGPEDGIFGHQTESGVLNFQKNAGLVMDGMVDDSVLGVIRKVTKSGEPHASDAKIPDRNGGQAARPLNKLLVAIDAGHGGSDEGACSASGLKEKELNLSIALNLARRLEHAQARVVLTRDADTDVSLYKRPEIANLAKADVFLSIHHNWCGNSRAQGAAVYYFCRQGYFSEAGKMLAEHMTRNLARDLKIPEIPVLGRNYAILRETSMMAVFVEPSFISAVNGNHGNIEYQDAVAGALLKGLTEYFMD